MTIFPINPFMYCALSLYTTVCQVSRVLKITVQWLCCPMQEMRSAECVHNFSQESRGK